MFVYSVVTAGIGSFQMQLTLNENSSVGVINICLMCTECMDTAPEKTREWWGGGPCRMYPGEAELNSFRNGGPSEGTRAKCKMERKNFLLLDRKIERPT